MISRIKDVYKIQLCDPILPETSIPQGEILAIALPPPWIQMQIWFIMCDRTY